MLNARTEPHTMQLNLKQVHTSSTAGVESNKSLQMLSTAHLHFAASPSPPSRYPTSTACPAHHCSYPPGMQHSGWNSKIQLYTRPPQDQCVLPMQQSRSATPTQSHPLSYCQLGSTLHPVREYTQCILDSIHMGTGAALSLFGVQEVNYVQELTDPQSSQGLLHTPLWVLSYWPSQHCREDHPPFWVRQLWFCACHIIHK